MNTLLRYACVLVLAVTTTLAMSPASARAQFERAELEQMLAPIALYPDSVLTHVLIAATYPDEVEEAAHWSRQHPDLEGEDAVAAVEDMDWDPSVKALVAFPEVLARMDEDMDWTERLGDAFLAQEGDVMDSVQTLRDHAYESGRLDSLEHVRVVRERELIYIEPAHTHMVYVPYYDPWYVYGTWWWPSYPPYCWRTWYGRPVAYYGVGFHWGYAFRVRPAFYFATFHWPARQVVVVHDHSRPIYSGRDVPRHRQTRHWRHDDSRQHASGNRWRGHDRPEHRTQRPEHRPERPQQRPQRPSDRPPGEVGRPERRDPEQRERQLRHAPQEQDVRRQLHEGRHERRVEQREVQRDRREMQREDRDQRHQERRETRIDQPRNERSGSARQPERPPERAQRPDHPRHVERPAERAERPEHSQRPQRAERPERGRGHKDESSGQRRQGRD